VGRGFESLSPSQNKSINNQVGGFIFINKVLFCPPLAGLSPSQEKTINYIGGFFFLVKINYDILLI